MTPGDNPQPESPSGPSAWWKRQSAKQKRQKIIIGVLLIAAAIYAWHYVQQQNEQDKAADISDRVKSSMQETLTNDARFSQYRLTVEQVSVIKQQGNQYAGMATVRSARGIEHQVPIQVTADGNNMMWQSEPGAFVWAALEQFNTAPAQAPTG